MLAREVPWGLFHLFGGLLVLVAGAEHAGLFLPLVGAVAAAEPLGVFGLPAVVFGMAVLANVMNNLPAALHRGIRPGEPVPRCTRRGDLAAAVIVGVNLGPNLTTVGSLATTRAYSRRDIVSRGPVHWRRDGRGSARSAAEGEGRPYGRSSNTAVAQGGAHHAETALAVAAGK